MKTKAEYGGYLPIELNHGQEYFQNVPMHRYNCAKAAINYLLKKLELKKIYVPYYLCPNVCKEIEGHQLEVIYYKLNDRLFPEKINDATGCGLYIVDYFGVMDEAISEYISKIKYATVIVDFCHSFYHKPILNDHVYNIYSAKKFFGVPDGAYLIAKNLEIESEHYSFSSEQSLYLLKSLEYGTNSCYGEKKRADEFIGQNYGSMSFLAKKILDSVNYEQVAKRRHFNFELYESTFACINLLKLEKNSIPYMYPLNCAKNIKKELVKEKVYVPTLWAQTLSKEFEGTLEYSLSKDTLFLPVDQRYDEKDIYHIIEIVKKYL